MNKLYEIIEILKDLRKLSGNTQIEELRKHKQNNLLKEVLTYTCDDKLRFKISDKKLKNASLKLTIPKDSKPVNWDTFKNILNSLSKLKATTDKQAEDVLMALGNESNEIHDLYKQVLLKDLALGFNKSTINKVFGNETLEKEYVMLATEYTEKTIVLKPRYSRKIDGIRCWVSEGKAYSRKNKLFPTANIQHILDEIKEFSEEYVFDGELIYIDDKGNESFKKTTNYVKKDEKLEGSGNVKYVVFYMVPKEDWFNRQIDLKLVSCFPAQYEKNIELGYSETLHKNVFGLNQFSEDQLEKLKENCKKYKWEGLMRIDADSTYQFKRSNVLQKIKEFQDAEFNIVDFKIGSKKYSNTLGSITIQLDCGSLVDVGSGFTDAEREAIWQNRDKIMADKDIKLKVQYFELSNNQKGGNSLRFPTFKGFRKNMEEYII